MRLSQLEISGFKSFSDRSHLSFDRGVTAIVGPNGCGKSNVADAITWVLGEQSAKSLRGDRMEDVIFNGSDARKPTGAAEVRLRLSDVLSATNGDLPSRRQRQRRRCWTTTGPRLRRTVEVTRRLYRSGESEYLIDGEICRLRDVHEFLMDTGLGAKAYAIIEQGKIGMILSSRPTDRRQLIEEAAGITKYKARRRAAELKLEAAQVNLTRLEDIIFELEKQFGSLKRQSAKARRYQRLRDEHAALGKGPVCRALSGISRENRSRFAPASKMPVCANRRARRPSAQRRRISAASASRWSRRKRKPRAARESVHVCELDINRRQQQIEFNRQQIEALGRFEPKRCAARPPRSTRGESLPASCSSSARKQPRRAQQDQRHAATELRAHRERILEGAASHRGARSRRRSGAVGGVFRAECRDDLAACDSSTPKKLVSTCRRSWPS